MQENAFKIGCDVLTSLYGPEEENNERPNKSVVFIGDEKLVALLVRFLDENIFVDMEGGLQK